MNKLKKTLKVFLIIILICFVGFKVLEYRFQLKAIPDGLGVWRLVYIAEEGGGFGPGANEGGIRVYALPEDAVEKIKKGGIEYLESLPMPHKNNRQLNKRNKTWYGEYTKWNKTPIIVSKYWTDYMSLPEGADFSKEKPSVYNFTNAYGFGPRIDSKIAELADTAITTSGNFYAYGRIGIIIIIPDKKRLIYVYNG